MPGDPMAIDAQADSEDPMTTDIPVDPVDPMSVDEPLFLQHPVPAWAQQIMTYLVDGTLPSEEMEARKVQRRAKSYTIINKELYKRSITGVLQRCVDLEQGKEILLDIHQGECGHHASS